MHVAVFASGGGTNLQSLLESCRPPEPAEVALVLSNKPDAGALERARSAGVATHVLDDPADGPAIIRVLEDARIDLVVLAGYLALMPRDVVQYFGERIVNIHPALLPAFGGKGMYGIRVHRAVLDAGATVSGVTIHLVDERYDEGPIVAQWPVPVHQEDTPETLAARILVVEHELLTAVVLAAGHQGAVAPLHASQPAFAAAAAADVTKLIASTSQRQ
ncbi:MAG: phosphoribosylglycinamide formyltransferase [Gemmatimonadetes bacterium]|nr:phosphoribosylglycinamide formyltransferase [Gemmatimonadota bacterium]